jgi:hypothetical protein
MMDKGQDMQAFASMMAATMATTMRTVMKEANEAMQETMKQMMREVMQPQVQMDQPQQQEVQLQPGAQIPVEAEVHQPPAEMHQPPLPPQLQASIIPVEAEEHQPPAEMPQPPLPPQLQASTNDALDDFSAVLTNTYRTKAATPSSTYQTSHSGSMVLYYDTISFFQLNCLNIMARSSIVSKYDIMLYYIFRLPYRMSICQRTFGNVHQYLNSQHQKNRD